jgi:hypothetical protein
MLMNILLLFHLEKAQMQCDQIGRNLVTWATIGFLRNQFLPKVLFLRFHKQFDVDVLGFQIKLGCRYFGIIWLLFQKNVAKFYSIFWSNCSDVNRFIIVETVHVGNICLSFSVLFVCLYICLCVSVRLFVQMSFQKHRRVGTQTNELTDSLAHERMDRQTQRCTYRHTDRHTHRETDRQMIRNTEKETKNSSYTDRHKDARKRGTEGRQTEIQTDRHIEQALWQTDLKLTGYADRQTNRETKICTIRERQETVSLTDRQKQKEVCSWQLHFPQSK